MSNFQIPKSRSEVYKFCRMRYWNNPTTGTSIVMKFNEVAHEVTAKPGLDEHFGLTPTSLHSLKKLLRFQ